MERGGLRRLLNAVVARGPLARVLARAGEVYAGYRKLLKIYPDTASIARRMFVTNSFDGLLAAIGVNVGGYRDGIDPMILALSMLGGAISMGILSGVVGVYLSERAERFREVRKLERVVGRTLRGSLYWRAASMAPAYIALWSGVGILGFPFLSATPYLAAAAGLIGVEKAFYLSLGISLGLMTFLGYYLGVVSGESRARTAARGLALGVGAVAVVYVFKTFLLLSPLG